MGPAGSEKTSPASEAPMILRSKISCDVRDGEMKAAASGDTAPIPKGFTGTQPSVWVTQTTCPAVLVVVFSPNDMRAGDIVLRACSSVRDRWNWVNTSQFQFLSP